MKSSCVTVSKTVILFILFFIAPLNSIANDTGALTAHSNLFTLPAHGGLSWTPDKLLGRNLLILNSFHEDDKRTQNLNKGIRQTFEKANVPIRYWVEYMDSKHFPYQSNEDNLKRIYKYKYSNKRLDAVIVTGNNALEFILKYRDKLFYGTPVVFTNISNFDLSKLEGQENITGIFEHESDEIFETIELALKLHPKTKKIVILSPGVNKPVITTKLRNKYKQQVEIEFSKKYFMSDIEKYITGLDSHNIILTISEPRTKNGTNISYYDFNKRIASISSSPVYAISDTGMGSGIVGGKLISGTELGTTAANMALAIFNGKPADEIPVAEDSRNSFMFDYNQLSRFNIKEKELPEASTIINKPFSVYNEYRNEINITIILLVVQAAIIFLLVVVNRKRKLAELKLKDVNENLEQRVKMRSIDLMDSNQQLRKEIEDRKVIEQALRISEEKYSKALLYSADSITITSLSDGKIVEVNEAFEKISGYTRHEVIGKTTIELGSWVNQSERDAFFKSLNKTGVINSFEADFKTKSGNILTLSLSAEIFEYQYKPHLIIISRDITEQRKMTLELKRYEQIVSSTSDLMVFIDNNFFIQAINESYLKALGLKRKNVIGRHLQVLYKDDHFFSEIQHLLKRCLKGESINAEKDLELSSKGLRHLDIQFNPFYENPKQISGIVISARDITSAKELSEQLHYQASHDDLTDLINRREFEQRVQRILNSDNLLEQQHVLCYLDLDQFKIINDTCGHSAGDELLIQLGLLLKKQFRQRDTIARLGGDEFAALFENCNLERAMTIMSKLQNTINNFRFVWEDKSFLVGVSIGIVMLDNHSFTVEELLKQADSACYMAKTDGRNCMRVYEHSNDKLTSIRNVMQWIHPVHDALENDSFKLYKQSIVSLNTDENEKISYQEILLRLDKGGELILPGLFLPTVEQYGLSCKLDKWVTSHIFNYLNQDSYPDSKYFINLSGLSLSSHELLQHIESELDQNFQLAHKICFEITETTAIANYTHASHFIDTLRKRGCEFALDDFGSGFSSFAYLKNLNVDYLKIDGMFIKDIINDPLTYSMVKSINEIGHISGIKTIAEFVEDEQILNELHNIGVDYAQGYGIGIPQPFDLAKQNSNIDLNKQGLQNVVSIHKKRTK